MKEAKGMVIKIDENTVYLITPDGEYLRGKPKGNLPEIGEETIITVNETKVAPTAKTKKLRKIIAAAAAMILFFTALYTYSSFVPGKAAAYLALDINPSMELSLDNKGYVLGAEAFNDDAESLLQKLAINNEHITESLEGILVEAEKQGYLVREEENIIQITYASDKMDEKTIVDIETIVEEQIQRNDLSALFRISKVDIEDKEESRSENITLNQLSLQREFENMGIELTEEDLQAPPGQIVRKYKQEEVMEGLKFKPVNTPGPPREVQGKKDNPGPPDNVPANPGPPEDLPGNRDKTGPPEGLPGNRDETGPPKNLPGNRDESKTLGPPEDLPATGKPDDKPGIAE